MQREVARTGKMAYFFTNYLLVIWGHDAPLSPNTF